jgi:hypothetical protein
MIDVRKARSAGYLDTIWNAFNAAEHADMSILPALLIRQKRSQAAAKR